MAKRKKKGTTVPSSPPSGSGTAKPAWKTASAQFRPDAEATPAIRAAMAQIDRLLALIPLEIVVQSCTPQNGRELHNWDVVAPAMLFSAANCLLSLRCLAMTPPPRREQDASILLRRMYEHVVCFAWIAIDPAANGKRWVAYDYRYRLATDVELQRLGKSGLDAGQRASFEAYRRANQDMPSLEQRARDADAHWLPRLAHHLDGRRAGHRAFSLADEYTSIYRFIWVGALARYRELGESLFPAGPVPQSTLMTRFQRPPVTPDTEISTIRRCLSSQHEGSTAVAFGLAAPSHSVVVE